MKKFYISFLALVLVAAMVVPLGVVNAGSGQVEVNGQIKFEWNGYYVQNKLVGNVIPNPNPYLPPLKGIIMGEMGHNVTYDGDIDGTAEEFLTFVMNTGTGEFPNYKVNSKGTQVFTGTVMGQEGTFTANVRHQMRLDGSGKVEQTIISGTGDLANIHGTLVFMIYRQADGSYIGDYSGKLHYAP